MAGRFDLTETKIIVYRVVELKRPGQRSQRWRAGWEVSLLYIPSACVDYRKVVNIDLDFQSRRSLILTSAFSKPSFCFACSAQVLLPLVDRSSANHHQVLDFGPGVSFTTCVLSRGVSRFAATLVPVLSCATLRL